MRDSTASSTSNGSERAFGSASLLIADIVFAAHRRISAVRADARLIRTRRKLASLDAAYDGQQACARIGKHGILVVLAGLDHRHERPFAGKGDIGSFIDLPG